MNHYFCVADDLLPAQVLRVPGSSSAARDVAFPDKEIVAAPERHRLVRELLDSDAAYFRAAAHCARLPGCEMVHMPGLESLAAGCLVQSLTPALHLDSPFWLKALEEKIICLGSKHARFYQQCPNHELEQCFLENGYRRTEEVALLNMFESAGSFVDEPVKVTLRAVRSEKDWAIKLALHQEITEGPDGHRSPAGQWLDMERQKCAAGYMHPFLIYCGNDACGSFNLSLGKQLGRLKNLVVHPGWRRRGVGVQAVRLIARLAQEHGMAATGCFAIDDGPSLELYQIAGYLPVARQIEWYKSLA